MSRREASTAKSVRSPRAAGLVALGLALVVLPLLATGGSQLSLFNHILITAVFAMSYNVLLGHGGMLSFGHAVYYGLAAFGAIGLMNWSANAGWGLPLPALPVAGFAVGAVAGWIGGWISTRQTGAIFAMITLGLGEMVHAATFIFPGVFGGEEGLSADRTLSSTLLGVDFSSDVAVYYLLLFWAVVSVLAMLAYLRTPLGQMAQAVRDNPERVASVGYDPRQVRRRAFVVAAGFAGLAGSLYAIQNELVTSANVSLHESGHIIFVTYIGGAGHPLGPVLGAVGLSTFEWWLQDASRAWAAYTGVLFVSAVLFAPRGIAGLIDSHAALPPRRAAARLTAPYAALIGALAAFLGFLALLIETAYALSFRTPFDPPFRFLGAPVDPAAAAIWAVGLAGLALAGAMLRWRWNVARRAYAAVADDDGSATS